MAPRNDPLRVVETTISSKSKAVTSDAESTHMFGMLSNTTTMAVCEAIKFSAREKNLAHAPLLTSCAHDATLSS